MIELKLIPLTRENGHLFHVRGMEKIKLFTTEGGEYHIYPDGRVRTHNETYQASYNPLTDSWKVVIDGKTLKIKLRKKKSILIKR